MCKSTRYVIVYQFVLWYISSFDYNVLILATLEHNRIKILVAQIEGGDQELDEGEGKDVEKEQDHF